MSTLQVYVWGGLKIHVKFIDIYKRGFINIYRGSNFNELCIQCKHVYNVYVYLSNSKAWIIT